MTRLAILSGGGGAYWTVHVVDDGAPPRKLRGKVRLDLAIGEARRHFDPAPFRIEVRTGPDKSPVAAVTWIQNARESVRQQHQALEDAQAHLRREQEALVRSFRGTRLPLCDIATMAGLSKRDTQAILDAKASAP